MVTRSTSQFTLNMLRRTILVLLLYGLLATCRCLVLRRSVHHGASIPIHCGQNGNSTECAMDRREAIEDGRNRTEIRAARAIRGETLEKGEVGIEEATSRKKKDKGYGQMLLYFLGASKITMLYAMMNAVAAIAGKALIVAKVAIAIAVAIALKKAEHKETVSYEIIKHPYHTYEHTHSSSIDYDHGSFGENDFNYRKRRRIYQ